MLPALGLVAGCRFPVVRTTDGDGTESNPSAPRVAHGPLDTINSSLLYARLQLAKSMQLAFPGYSTCDRCRWPWAVVRGHVVVTRKGWGMFSICEDCWSELRSSQCRIPYYKKLYDSYDRTDNGTWEEYEDAIKAEDPYPYALDPASWRDLSTCPAGANSAAVSGNGNVINQK
jgi:hypothetical protein